MSNPEEKEAGIANLSDDYIRNLKPEGQRYDITLAQDFVISVLPNGIKTWAFIYDFQGRHRRKTLGVFPDMNFNEARLALEQARTAIVRMDEPTMPPDELGRRPAVLGGGHYVPKGETKSAGRWLKWVIVLLVLLLGAGAYYLFKNRPSILPTNTSTPSAPFDVLEKDEKPSVASIISKSEEARTESTKPEPSSSKASPPTTVMSDTSNQTQAGGSTAPSTGTEPSRTAATPTTTYEEAVQAKPTQITSPSEQAQPTSSESETPAQAATAYGGRVARSSLTSKVENLEPTDQLGPEISAQDSGFIRVFYFTELREFSSGVVVHRWELNGKIMEEVELNVQKSWRWRTYSNKDITPGLTGVWTVSTIDASGTVLDRESFTYDY